MISKIKDLVQISTKIDEINAKMDQNSESVDRHSVVLRQYSEEVKGVKKDVTGLSADLGKFVEESSEMISEIGSTNEQLKRELYELNLLKSEIKTKLVAELAEAFREELRLQTRELNTDVKIFNRLKDDIVDINGQLKTLKSEMERFGKIAQELKSADFEMSKYAREIAKADSEKLRLMKEVDNLQRLLSKERRNRPPR